MLPIDAIGATLSAETASISQKLSAAVASGSAHDIRVELEALHTFYNELWQVEGVLQQAQQSTKEQATFNAVRGIGTEISEVFEGSVPGVDQAVNAALGNVSGSSHGLGSVLTALHAIVVKNLQAVYDTYMAYLNADNSGASDLTSAASQTVENHWNGNADQITATVLGNEFGSLAKRLF